MDLKTKMQFIGEYQLDGQLCDRLIDLHKAGDKQGLVVRGKLGKEGGGYEVDESRKDSYDLGLNTVPEAMIKEYGLQDYFQSLLKCIDSYYKEHPILKCVGAVGVVETPIIQYYKPGGGFKFEHFERTGKQTAYRQLTFMTYLNDVTDGGGTRFVYQDLEVTARKGKTLIWPTDFTHTHVGVVSPSQEKYIITGWLNYLN